MSTVKAIWAILLLVALLIVIALLVGNNTNQGWTFADMRSGMLEKGRMMMDVDDTMMGTINDQSFLLNMIPHHQEAIDTANEVLERGGVIPEVKELVQDIITAQEKEVADMKSWYQEWYGTPYQNAGTYEPMMRELANLSGKELDLVFVEDMWMHHMGALHMAGAVLQTTKRPELQTLGQNILRTQRAEMQLMQQIYQEHTTN